MVEKKLEGIHETPRQILGGLATRERVLPDVVDGHTLLSLTRKTAEAGQVELIDKLAIVSHLPPEPREGAALMRQFCVNGRRIQEMKHLGNAGLAVALAFARAGAYRPAEELQEVMGNLAVPQLDRPVARRHARVLLGHARRLAHHVKQHFGVDPLESGTREILLVALVRLVRPR